MGNVTQDSHRGRLFYAAHRQRSCSPFARTQQNHPTFLYVTFNAPHSPLQAPQKFIDRYSTLENQNRRIFAAMVDAMDEEIGRILKVIDEEKMRENTIVLFMSDNGGVTRDGASNEPLAKGKGSVYEGGIRVPAVIRWPGVLPKGQKTDQLITVHDLFPTLATALRVEPRNSQPFYGEDLWQSLVSERSPA
jgi:arylsulfatase A-like enzyme